jgi:ribonuclease P protein component
MTVFFLSAPSVISSSVGECAKEDAYREGDFPVRVGFTVPKALGGAVDRNRIRRRVREAVRRHIAELESMPAMDVVINPKRTARDADFEALSDEVRRAIEVIRRSALQSGAGESRAEQSRERRIPEQRSQAARKPEQGVPGEGGPK